MARPSRFSPEVRERAVRMVWEHEDVYYLHTHLNNITNLFQERGFNHEQAYVICSVAVDLRISNAVDQPNVTVSAFLPEEVLQDRVSASVVPPGPRGALR